MEVIRLKKGYIKNEDIRCALKVPRHTALRIAQKLVDLGILKRIGKGKGMKYMKHENEIMKHFDMHNDEF